MVILNKVDLAGSEQVAKVRTWIDDHFNRLWVVEAINCDVPLEVLLAVGRLDPAASFDGSNADDRVGGHAPCDSHDHDDDRSHDPDATFSTWSFETVSSCLALCPAGDRAPKTSGIDLSLQGNCSNR